jgi:hypothetical protein
MKLFPTQYSGGEWQKHTRFDGPRQHLAWSERRAYFIRETLSGLKEGIMPYCKRCGHWNEFLYSYELAEGWRSCGYGLNGNQPAGHYYSRSAPSAQVMAEHRGNVARRSPDPSLYSSSSGGGGGRQPDDDREEERDSLESRWYRDGMSGLPRFIG